MMQDIVAASGYRHPTSTPHLTHVPEIEALQEAFHPQHIAVVVVW